MHAGTFGLKHFLFLYFFWDDLHSNLRQVKKRRMRDKKNRQLMNYSKKERLTWLRQRRMKNWIKISYRVKQTERFVIYCHWYCVKHTSSPHPVYKLIFSPCYRYVKRAKNTNPSTRNKDKMSYNLAKLKEIAEGRERKTK